jgi:hypothetical protein
MVHFKSMPEDQRKSLQESAEQEKNFYRLNGMGKVDPPVQTNICVV